MKQLFGAFYLVAVALFCAPVLAADELPLGLSEVRGGYSYTGVELWTVFRPYKGKEQFAAWDTAHVELVFTPPDDTLLAYLGNPRVVLGGHLSTIGRASLVYTGLNWHANIMQSPLFLEGTLGGALTDSTLAHAKPPNRNVGCPALLYFSAAAGFELGDNWSIMGEAYHASHSNLCNFFVPDAKNDGLNGVGIKVGYRF